MAIFDPSSAIGLIITALAEQTGSVFLALFVIMMLLFAIAILLRIPIELTLPLFFPFIIVATIMTTSYFAIAGIVIMYLSIILAKNFFV